MEAIQDVELFLWLSSSLNSLDDLLFISSPGGDPHKSCVLPFQMIGPQPVQGRFSHVLSAFILWVCSMRICFDLGNVPSSSGQALIHMDLLRFLVSWEHLMHNTHPSHAGFLSHWCLDNCPSWKLRCFSVLSLGIHSQAHTWPAYLWSDSGSTDTWWHMEFNWFH